MKKEYMKPTMQVVKLQQTHIICSSSNRAAKSITNGEGINWKNDGFADDEDDY